MGGNAQGRGSLKKWVSQAYDKMGFFERFI
jgi:hypothetical protein